ncbi:unnamed protein product [Microthlaspi erraticum]|uniref:Uncharacterized protein n=1 Tax=Microthlaspi erraticum TaxID=1685480 RepID=A0A6D2JYA1_9BRAS|nr:unnamed protein product [Microthlaspi erraticum]
MLARYREMLDTASNGNFLNQDVDDGWQLVENMAISMEVLWRMSRNAPTTLTRASQRFSGNEQQVVEINSKLESLTSRVQIIESSSASSSSPQEYAQAVTLRSGGNFQAEVAHPKSLWTSMTRKGRIWSSMLISQHRTRSSWNKTLNQSSIELRNRDSARQTRARSSEKRTDKASSSQPTKPVGKKKDTPSGPPPYKPLYPFQEGSRNNCWKHTRPSLMN